jgi:hypothetical protein
MWEVPVHRFLLAVEAAMCFALGCSYLLLVVWGP